MHANLSYMMTRFTRLLLLCFSVFLFSFSSCLKQKYDGPPDTSGYDPQLTVTHTIAKLLQKPQGVAITEDVVIAGLVVMDDRSGNYYKSLVIEDSTAGVQVLIDQNNLYNDYPVGRKVYIKCKGLYVGNYNGNPQLGSNPDNTGALSNIPAILVNDYIVKANYPNPVVPDTFTLAELANIDATHLNTLVAIKNVEFDDASAGVPYAQVASLASATSLNLKDCNGGKAILRSSGYAKFQPYLTPAGNGMLVGIFTKYRTDIQLYIRDTSDITFYGQRCDGSGGNNEPSVITHLDALRSMTPTTNDSINVLSQTSITGIVISDKTATNIATANLIIQDGDKGIAIRFTGNHSLSLGDSVTIDITGGKLSWYNNMLQLSNIAVSKAVKYGSGKIVTPRTATLAQCTSNYSNWESTLVKITGVSVTGGGTYSGNKTITDASGSFTMYTRSAATFSAEMVPSSPKTFTGILGIFASTKQLQLRNLNDVQ